MAIRKYESDKETFYEVYVNGFDSRGRRIQRKRKGIETLRKAETVEFELKRELARSREESASYRWDEWFEECFKRMKIIHRPSTMVSYDKQLRKWILPRWGNLEIGKIGRLQVHSVIFDEIAPGVAPSTLKCILKMVRRIFEMAVEEGILDRNPCAGIQVKVPEVEQKVLTNSEVEIFLREAKLTGHRFYPMWAMALMTGMRSGELFALQWNDLDFEAKSISVTKSWNSKYGIGPTKSQRTRVVPVSDALLMFLKERRLRHGAESEFVLPRIPEWESGEQARVTREFCDAIGVTSVKFHDLRATFITNLLARGESLARVMAIVGHSQIKTTNCYLRKAGVDVKGGTDKLGYKLPSDQSGAVLLSLVQS